MLHYKSRPQKGKEEEEEVKEDGFDLHAASRTAYNYYSTIPFACMLMGGICADISLPKTVSLEGVHAGRSCWGGVWPGDWDIGFCDDPGLEKKLPFHTARVCPNSMRFE